MEAREEEKKGMKRGRQLKRKDGRVRRRCRKGIMELREEVRGGDGWNRRRAIC